LHNMKYNFERQSATLQTLKHDGGAYSQTDNYAFGANITHEIMVNVSSNVTRACRVGGSCTSVEVSVISTLADYFAIQSADTLGGTQRFNVSQIIVYNTGTPYNNTIYGGTAMNVTFYSSTGTKLYQVNGTGNGTTVAYDWTGLSGTKSWYVNVWSNNSRQDFGNFTFTLYSAETNTTYCTTGNSIAHNVSGVYNITIYNVTAGTGSVAYFNTTYNNYNLNSSNKNYWYALLMNTSQARLTIQAYRLFLNTSIFTFNITNNNARNTTTTSSLVIPASNGTNNLEIRVPGNYTINLTCTVATPLSVGYCNATGVYDTRFIVKAYNSGSAISNFNLSASNATLLATNIVATNTSNGTITFNTLREYQHNLFFTSSVYADANASILPDEATEYYNFTAYVARSLNVTFRDEVTKAIMNYTTVTFELISDVQSENRTTSNGTLFLELLTPANYTVRYRAPGYLERFYQFEITTSGFNNLNLTLLNASEGTNVSVTVLQNLGLPLVGAAVKVLKYDIATNTYMTNQIVETNAEGKTQINILLNSEYYKFIIEYEGNVVYSSERMYIYGTTLTFQVSLLSNPFTTYFANNDLSGSITFSPNTATFSYNDESNTATACLYAYYLSTTTKTYYNSTCSASSSGEVSTSVDNVTGRTYYFEGLMYSGDTTYTVSTYTYTFKDRIPDGGAFGLLITAILLITAVFIMRYHLGLGIILGASVPLLVAVTGMSSLSVGATAGVFVLGLIVAYIIEVRR